MTNIAEINNIAERRFSWLARQRGCELWHEDQLEQVIEVRGKRPDFYVRSPSGDFLAEVKAFVAQGPLDRRTNRVFSVGIDELLKPIQGVIDEAAPQLRAYADAPIARVIVLDNWRQVGISLEDEMLIQVFGELLFVVPVSAHATALPPPHMEYGGGRSLGNEKRTYVSAIVVTEPLEREGRDDFSIERPMRARVLHNPFAVVPLAISVFNHPDDQQLVYDVDRWRTYAGDRSSSS